MAAADGLRGAAMNNYIVREAFIDGVVKRYCAPCKEHGCDLDGDWCRDCVITCVLKMVRDAPAADVEPVRNGRWEECDWVDVDEHGFGTRRTFKAGLRCSQCACVFKKELLWKRNWCPNCGAKMEGGADG